jgi:hypothetical protein
VWISSNFRGAVVVPVLTVAASSFGALVAVSDLGVAPTLPPVSPPANAILGVALAGSDEEGAPSIMSC